jgi:putative zinc finger protein
MAECVHLVRTSSYFDGALPAGDEAEAVEHLAGCDECQALLRDAATLDAVTSQAPPRAQVQPRRRRWPLAAAAIGVAVAAAIALWLAVPHGGGEGVPELAIELPKARAIEARFTGAHLGAYRPYDPLRGDRAHEAIALATLAELERRGDAPDLIAALAATGDLARAGELAARRPDDAAAEADRAALALAAGATDDAFVHAYRAVDRAPALAAGWWNLALAARTAGLWHVSRAAFAKVADRAEPGWSDEARRQIAAIDRQIAADHIPPAQLRARAAEHQASGRAALARAELDEATR